MKRVLRKNEILEILDKYGYVTVEYLSRNLHISESSIRRDLMLLEADNMCIRSHGGVHSTKDINPLTPYEMRTRENSEAKKIICKKAIELISNGDVIFIDASTTCLFLAELLGNKSNITVLTNSLSLAMTLESCKGITVYSTGGLLRLNEHVGTGAIAESACNYIHTDLMFFSARAIDDNGNIMDINEPETRLRRIAMKNTDKAVFLCDSTKFNKKSVFTVCNINDISYIITDKPPVDSDWDLAKIL